MNVVITGGGSGLGRAIVERFALDGSNRVLFSYCHTATEVLDVLCANDNVSALKCDFTDRADLQSLIAKAGEFDTDLLVNNSWLGLRRQHFHRFRSDDLVDSFSRNVAPTVELSKHMLKAFKKRRSGRVINVLTSALIGNPPVGMSIYAAEKAYIMQLAKSWVVEFGDFGVAINNVLPGFMATDMNAEVDERVIEQIRSSSPGGELLTTAEMAQSVYLLAHKPLAFTGNNLSVNHGDNLAN